MTDAETICLAVAIVLIVWGLFAEWFTRWQDRPLTDWDDYCTKVDAELDELWAQDQVRPFGHVDRA